MKINNALVCDIMKSLITQYAIENNINMKFSNDKRKNR